MQAFATRALFAVTVFLAAALVFLVQPLVARQLLPTFGGTPAVWNTAVVFFQVVLLAGYALAHVTMRWLGPRRQAIVQLGLSLVVLGFLPFAMRTGEPPPESVPPAAWIAALLALGVGVPYLAVATASPVLQRWYAAIDAPDSVNPYFLYSASNAGSLLGLLAFPFLLEPSLGVAGQERAWAGTFLAYLLGLGACALVLRRRVRADAPASVDRTGATTEQARDHIRPRQALRWVLVAAIPASLMLGATTFITTDVASAPLLWVVPLSLYLISFMVTFGRRVRITPGPAGLLAAAAIVLLLLVEVDLVDLDELGEVLVHLAALLASATLCHALLYAERPPARHLTGFYLLLSLGGALGGSFTALVAPALFDGIYEYPLLLAAALALRPPAWRGPRRWRERAAWRAGASLVELTLAATALFVLASAALDGEMFGERVAGTAWLAATVVACALLALRRWGLVLTGAGALVVLTMSLHDDAIHVERNFYGTLRVEQDEDRNRLLHGTTLHGAQFRAAAERDVPTTYYVEAGPVGDAFEHLQHDEPFVEVGAVGLGTGSLLGHARLWQRFTFYEIDPAVIRVARDPELFRWVSDAQVDVRIVEGDARLQLDVEHEPRFDLLVLDAYSSDAVPIHLLTVEAFELYLERLAADGVLLVHVSSRHLDLEPVVAANARRLELAGLTRVDEGLTPEHVTAGGNGSHWIVLARDPDPIKRLIGVDGWRSLVSTDADDAWTDDRSDIAGAIQWLPAWLGGPKRR